jgi:histidine triad (HIT) family protein
VQPGLKPGCFFSGNAACLLVSFSLAYRNGFEIEKSTISQMSWQENCSFCRIIAGSVPAEIVYEDEDVVAFRDRHPQAPHHVLVIPRRHISGLQSITDSDVPLLGKLLATARKVAQSLGLERSGYRVVINSGAGAGQSIFHLHVHVLGGRPMSWPPG